VSAASQPNYILTKKPKEATIKQYILFRSKTSK